MFFYRILAFRRADFPHATRAVLAVLRLVERHARHSTIALMSHFARSVVGLHTHCVQSSIFVEVARSCALYVLSFRDCIPQGSLRYATSASFLKLPPVAIKQESCRTHQNPLPCLAHTRAPRVSSLLYRSAITRSTALCESTINDTKCEKTSEKYRALPKGSSKRSLLLPLYYKHGDYDARTRNDASQSSGHRRDSTTRHRGGCTRTLHTS